MKEHKKLLFALFLAVLAGTFLYLAFGPDAKKSSREYQLIYIPKTGDETNDFWSSLLSGARMAAQEDGVELTILAPDEEQDISQQETYLKQAIEEKPDALLLTPSSFEEYNDLLRQAKEEGIFLAFIDSYVSEDLQDLLVATDNIEAGRQLGEFTKGLVGEDDQIAIVSHVKGVSTAVEREQGFREGLGDLEKNIVEVVYCDSLFDKSTELTKELMKKYPDLKLIAGMNEYSSVGAARAVKSAGAKDKITVVGIDSSQEAIQMMEEGVFKGLVIQKAFKMGYLGVKDTIRALNGEDVEKNVDSGCQLVTPENMYDSEIEKLLFPFSASKDS